MNLLTNLMAWYDFEELFEDGHTAMDQSGRGHHIPGSGTFKDPVSGTNLPYRTARRYVAGKAGYAVDVAVSKYLYKETHVDFAVQRSVNGFTVAFWFRTEPTGLVGGQIDMVAKAAWGGGTLDWGFSELLGYYFLAATTTTGGKVASTFPTVQSALPWGSWHFVVGFVDPNGSNQLSLQIDNGTIYAGSVWTGVGIATSCPFFVGPYNASPIQSGQIDSLGLWKRPLTQSERTWLYNGGLGRRFSDIYVPVATTNAKSITCNCSDL